MDSTCAMNGTPAELNKSLVAQVNAVLSGQLPLGHLEQIIDAEFRDHAAFPGQKPGREGFIDAVKSLREAFDQTVESLHTVAEGALVIDHWVSRGTHRGRFAGIEPTGRGVRVEGFSVWRIAGNKLVEAWGLVDLAGLMRQLRGP
jgi:predicted ester cyclase